MVGVPAVSAHAGRARRATAPTMAQAPRAVSAPAGRSRAAPHARGRPRPRREPASGARRRRIRHAGALAFTLVVLGLLGSGAYLALQSVYFIGTNSRGLVTLFQGLPYRLPGNLDAVQQPATSPA